MNSKQILYLLNSTDIQSKLRKSPWLDAAGWHGDARAMARDIYLRVLSRPATSAEQDAVAAWTASAATKGIGFRTAAESLVWALLNTDEFLFLN